VSHASRSVLFPPPLIVIVDTSCLIAFKRLVRIDEQWALLVRMSDLVRSGALAFPRQVAKELSYGQHPDAPGAWVGNAKGDIRHPEPREETLVAVLQVAPQLVDYEATADREVADPYVAAMAVELVERHRGCRVAVATDDAVDRLPVKLSLRTACRRLTLEVWSTADLVAWVRGEEPAGA
jgi:hypothetical protein